MMLIVFWKALSGAQICFGSVAEMVDGHICIEKASLCHAHMIQSQCPYYVIVSFSFLKGERK
jgi:hypothetical protein